MNTLKIASNLTHKLTRFSNNSLLFNQFKSSSSLRGLQILARREKPGFFDQISGMYENGQRLEGKPLEFRDGRFLYYIAFLGTAIVAFLSVFPGILWAFFCLFSYTTRDSQVVVNRRNPHPFLLIKNGLDMNKTFNPFLGRAIPFSVLNTDKTMMFYNELQMAHRREL